MKMKKLRKIIKNFQNKMRKINLMKKKKIEIYFKNYKKTYQNFRIYLNKYLIFL